jgi:hypothetical protein
MTLVLAVLLFAAPAPAGTRLEQGQKAFSEGQFDAAIKLLDAAAAEERDPSALEKIHLLRGQAFAARQDFGRAEAAFALALEANPEAALDPGKVDPAVVKLLESMRSRSSGTVSFRSTPPGASVTLDGADAGTAPGAVTTVIGRHKLTARWPDDASTQLEVMVHSKRETFVELVLLETEKEKVVTVVKEVPVEVAKPMPPPPAERIARPWGGVRGTMDVNSGPEYGIDFGGGVDFKYLSIGAYLRPYRYFYVVPRVAGLWPVLDVLTLFLEAEVDVRPSDTHFGLALGGNVGAEYFLFRFLGVFVEAGGKGFFINHGFVVDARLTLGAGVRVRLP